MKSKLFLLPSFIILTSCSTEWMGSNTTKSVLREIGTMVFTAAVQSFTTDKKVDFGHAMAQGIWEQGGVAIDSGAVKRIADAWSADHLPKLAATTFTACQIANPQTLKQKEKVIDAIATAISQAAAIHES